MTNLKLQKHETSDADWFGVQKAEQFWEQKLFLTFQS